MAADQSRIASVGVPTRDRTDALERCLTGFLDNGRRHGRTHDYVVVDDSPSPEVRGRNRALLQSLRRRYGAELSYAGPEEKARFAAALVRAGLPADAVAFALLNPEDCPVTTGGSRNALLLHGVGDLLLQTDDDTLCRYVPVPGALPGLARSPRFDPTEFWFFAEGEALPPATADEEDGLAVHEQLLGTDVAGAPSGRVLLTAAGLVGDAGMGSPVYLLALEGSSRERLLRDERAYRHALTHRRVLRAAPGATVCAGAFCMAPNLGLDHRRMLPPFLPVQRNQDGVFGALVRACFPGGLFGFLPWAVLHLPPAPRPWSADDLGERAACLRTGQIVQALVGACASGAGRADARDNLRALGTALTELGALRLADFEDVVRRVLRRHLDRLAAGLEGRLQQFGGSPDYWADDVRCVVGALRQALGNENTFGAVDLQEAFGVAEARPRLRRLVGRFGGLLRAWPDMVEAARQLRAAGFRPALPLLPH
jgi:hypothetical protein